MERLGTLQNAFPRLRADPTWTDDDVIRES